jgi:hypothetical protein
MAKNTQEVYGKAREHKMGRSLANVIQGKHSDKRFGVAVKDDWFMTVRYMIFLPLQRSWLPKQCEKSVNSSQPEIC